MSNVVPTDPPATPTTPTVTIVRPAPAPPALRRIGAVGSWLVLTLVTLVVLGLLAITVGPKVLPYQALVVRSGSMAPTIPTGSIVVYRHAESSTVKVGDVIAFNKPGDPSEKITHRVYKIEHGQTGRYFITKGDANGAPDDWQVPAVGEGWIASFHVPVVGYVLYDLQSTAARLLLLLVPALLLGGITLYELWRDRGRKRGAPA